MTDVIEILVNHMVAIILQHISESHQPVVHFLNLHGVIYQLHLNKAGKISKLSETRIQNTLRGDSQ